MNKYDLLKEINHLGPKENKINPFLLTEESIWILHSICCSESEKKTYRTSDISATGKDHKPPHPEEIEHFMNHFIGQLETSIALFHPVEFAAIAYKRFLDLSPFTSHNEETAALFLNVLLSSAGYPIIQNPVFLPGYAEAMEKARIMPFPDTDELTCLVGEEILRHLVKTDHNSSL